MVRLGEDLDMVAISKIEQQAFMNIDNSDGLPTTLLFDFWAWIAIGQYLLNFF